MQRIRFDAGEQRHIKLRIHAAGDAPFRIHSSSWELRLGNSVKDSGDCEIDGHIIDIYLTSPVVKTSYVLHVTYNINDETLVEQLELVVI